MNIETKIANWFSVPLSSLKFDDCQYFAFSNSCTVAVNNTPFDVWFDESLNIVKTAIAQ